MHSQRDRSRSQNQNPRHQWVPKVRTPANVGGLPSSSNSSSHDGGHRVYNARDNSGLTRTDPVKKTHSILINPRQQQPDHEKIHAPPLRNQRGRAPTQQGEEKKAFLPQLLQEIQENLLKGSVECMICYDMVRRSASIWSCTSCYSIFHLACIKKWARAPTSIDLQAEKNQGFNWRCPGCQAVQLTEVREIQYTCFCGNTMNPSSDLYLVPHSCGEPCGKLLEKKNPSVLIPHTAEYHCPHHCILQCHPGPCPPCKLFAAPRPCPCGKKTLTLRCSEGRSPISCGQICDKLLDCGRHRCTSLCHSGPCNSCSLLIEAICFCNGETQTLHCNSLPDEEGGYSCRSVCGKKLECGNHSCGEICHPGACPECDRMPATISTCCCGRSPLLEERQSCLDPIPTCSATCAKGLSCGVHECEEPCHDSPCPPCSVTVRQRCRCGSTSRAVECSETARPFACDKPCGRKKTCGRHRCSERCCDYGTDRGPHQCSMVCEKRLRCGQHGCTAPCHTGHCPPCMHTIFADLSCACGMTSVPPPLPCGTPPPTCPHPCSVPSPCGHPSSHGCHSGDCPPCPVPIAKQCVGGHVVIRNIPCGSKEIRCNHVCGKTRRCGVHTCIRPCHAPPCDPASDPLGSCGQTCGVPRGGDCPHTCTAPCHPRSPCPDSPCDAPVTITCSCGRISLPVPCGGPLKPVPESPVPPVPPVPPLRNRKLSCDDECARLERKRVLADAFDAVPPNLDALDLDGNAAVSELFRRDPKWVLSVVERCRFLLRKGRAVPRVHVFSPMPKDRRDAAKLIAGQWKFSSRSAGWEPKRFVIVSVTPKSKAPARAVANPPASPPAFDHTLDMDPRVVVLLFDLPNDADISTLVLRFGGECELVWLSDRNALAVFGNPARAATALRRLEHASAYDGAFVSGSSGAAAGIPESGSRKDRRSTRRWCDAEEAVAADLPGPEDSSIVVSTDPFRLWDSEACSSGSSSATGKMRGSTVAHDSHVAQGDDVLDDWESGC